MTGSELARFEQPVSAFELLPQAHELAVAIAKTEFVPTSLRGRPEAVMAAVLAGNELGLPPMTSLSKVHVIEGRPSLSADVMRALVLNRGHEVWCEDASSTSVTMAGRRAGSDQITRIAWTMDDARRAQLERKQNWQRYPRAMLTARATGELCRLLFADVLAGISYTSEEVRDGFTLEDDDAGDLAGAPDGVEPPAPKSRTRKAGSSSGAGKAAAAPPAPPAPPLPGEVAAGEAVEVVDHAAGDTNAPDTSGRSYTPPQALAIRANEVGLSDEQRHGLYLAITAGRASSGNDLERDEIDGAFEALEQIELGALELEQVDGHWHLSVAASGVVVFSSEPEAAGDNLGEQTIEVPELPADEAGWRSLLRKRKVRLADLLRQAHAVSGENTGLPAIVADPELAAQMMAWVLEQEGQS